MRRNKPSPLARETLSLAGHLTLLFALASFLLLSVFSAFLYWGVSRNLYREDDEFLTSRLQSVVSVLAAGSPSTAALEHEGKGCFLRIQDKAGRLVFETAHRPKQSRHTSTTLPSGWRIEVAMDTREDDTFRIGFARMTILALLLGTGVAAGLGYGVARRGLRPVRQIAETVKGIGAADLTPRVALQGRPEELRVLAESFDDLLTRLNESFARLSQFSADMAHELRTPLANLRGEAEVALTRSRTPEEYEAILASSLEEYERLSRLIDNLLFLARAENPEATLKREPINTREEAEKVMELYGPLAQEAGVTVEVEGEGGLYGDRELVQRALANLIENAITHSGRGSHVTIQISEGKLIVSDTGRGIAPEHLPRLFDRLYRADASRRRGGSGLGLAMVRTIARLHGGDASVQSELGQGTVITLILST